MFEVLLVSSIAATAVVFDLCVLIMQLF